MATPASSATSPSPPMAYLSHGPTTPQPLPAMSNDAQEKDNRQMAVQKFLARAEVSMVTRALRARLSYASYKATHNISHVPLRDLEAQTSQSQAASFTRTIAAKRKAAGLPQYYPPSGQGPSAPSPGSAAPRRPVGSGAMLPPSSVHSPRSYHSAINGQPTSAAYGETASHSRSGSNSAPNLYTSLLAPPPTKQARTIHNVHDPPVPAPIRPAPSPRPRHAEHRSHTKGRHSDRASKHVNSPDRRKAKRTSGADKGKRRQHGGIEVDADGDVDMKAAAALTSLLFHSRPSIGGTSPRSSIDGSDAGSQYSYSHFAQSSARTTTVPVAPPPSSTPPTSSQPELALRHTTPPSVAPVPKQTTPRTLPTEKDSEAADLMLYLATSPSPARPSKARDQAAFQTLSGATTRPKGRVLFQAGTLSDQPPGEPSSAGPGSLRPSTTLTRSGEGSFVSSMSSIGSELGSGTNHKIASSAPSSTYAHPPLPTPNTAQLLPPPSLGPAVTVTPANPDDGERVGQSPNPIQSTPGQAASDFNFHEFINASPSPSRGAIPTNKVNHGLRADVGRRLFEEEQMRAAASISEHGVVGGRRDAMMDGSSTRVQEQQQAMPSGGLVQQRPLGAGINIAQG